RENLTEVQLKSFEIADHVQKSIWELDNLVLRYALHGESNDWSRFEQQSKTLDDWIDQQRPVLSTEKERQVLDLINTNYDYYVAAARLIEAKVKQAGEAATHLVEFENFEKQSQQLQKLGFQLGLAHRESMDNFLTASNKALSY